jgi:hypothetical protein
MRPMAKTNIELASFYRFFSETLKICDFYHNRRYFFGSSVDQFCFRRMLTVFSSIKMKNEKEVLANNTTKSYLMLSEKLFFTYRFLKKKWWVKNTTANNFELISKCLNSVIYKINLSDGTFSVQYLVKV